MIRRESKVWLDSNFWTNEKVRTSSGLSLYLLLGGMFDAANNAGNPFGENIFGSSENSSELEWIPSKYLVKYEAVYEQLGKADSRVSREGNFIFICSCLIVGNQLFYTINKYCGMEMAGCSHSLYQLSVIGSATGPRVYPPEGAHMLVGCRLYTIFMRLALLHGRAWGQYVRIRIGPGLHMHSELSKCSWSNWLAGWASYGPLNVPVHVKGKLTSHIVIETSYSHWGEDSWYN